MSQYGRIGWGGRQAVAWLGPGPDGEDTGDLTGPMDGAIDPVAGHGTFIAGLIRQLCPDADVLSVRIVRSDGLIVEGDLVATLGQVYELARRYAAGEPGGYPIDVVSMSMGYYHELPHDADFDPTMLRALRRLGELGIAVVVSAGNDATADVPGRVHAQPAGPDHGTRRRRCRSSARAR